MLKRMSDETEVFEHTYKKKGVMSASGEKMELCENRVWGVSASEAFLFH